MLLDSILIWKSQCNGQTSMGHILIMFDERPSVYCIEKDRNLEVYLGSWLGRFCTYLENHNLMFRTRPEWAAYYLSFLEDFAFIILKRMELLKSALGLGWDAN
jgi:hypothetical protein